MTNKIATPIIKFVDSESKFAVYTNHTGIALSLFDIRIIFGQTQAPVAGGQEVSEMTVVSQGSVILSPLHAKMFCTNLLAHIEKYESTFGKINVPTNLPTVLPPTQEKR